VEENVRQCVVTPVGLFAIEGKGKKEGGRRNEVFVHSTIKREREKEEKGGKKGVIGRPGILRSGVWD